MPIIPDTNQAIQNFLRFGLDGPTKYDELGEKYLRLYGDLNATYIQQEALLKLYKLANAPNLKGTTAQTHSLRIRELRNKFGAHTINFSKSKEEPEESYVSR